MWLVKGLGLHARFSLSLRSLLPVLCVSVPASLTVAVALSLCVNPRSAATTRSSVPSGWPERAARQRARSSVLCLSFLVSPALCLSAYPCLSLLLCHCSLGFSVSLLSLFLLPLLSAQEFRHYYSQLYAEWLVKGLGDDHLRRVFESFDVNGNGDVSRDEFRYVSRD